MNESQDPAVTLAEYARGPEQLESIVAGLSDEALDSGPVGGGWTIRQIVHHIVDGDDLWKMCIKAALGNDHARFGLPWYWDIPQERWAESWRYAERAIEPSLALLRANRAHILQLLDGIPGAWERLITVDWSSGQSDEGTIGDVIAMQAQHVCGHVEDIRRIRQACEQ